MEAYQAANELFVDEEFEAALEHYNKAIASDTEAPRADFFLRRAACHLKLNNPMAALQDANAAIKLQPTSGPAHLRKGIACFELEEYESAKESFEASRAIVDSSAVRRWIRKCEAEIDEDASEDGDEPQHASSGSQPQPTQPQPIPTLASEEAKRDPLPPAKPTARHEWYQSPTAVTITIFAKGIKKEQCTIEPTTATMTVSIQLDKEVEYALDLMLCDEIVAEDVSVAYMPTKVEIKMPKRKQCKWLTLEKTDEQIRTLDWDTSKSSMPEYPSSSKIKKNWDAISKDVEEEKLEGEQALNKVFQDIFSRGSDEQRRAMEKSFVESGGTVLSTNWQDVGSRHVEGSAPKGAEIKKWSDVNK